MKQPHENKKFLDDLANEGWFKMNEILNQHQPIKKKADKRVFYINTFRLAAIVVSLLLLTTATFVYFNNDKQSVSALVSTNRIESDDKKDITGSPNKSDTQEQMSAVDFTKEESILSLKQTVLQSPKTIFIKNYSSQHILDSLAQTSIMRAILKEETSPLKPMRIKANTVETPKPLPLHEHQPKKKNNIQLYAGAGMNLSGNKGLFIQKVSIHPVVTVVIPMNKRWSVHTGVSAFSALHSSYNDKGEKVYVNSVADNVLYKINTTSVVKVKYFDLPVSVHYALSENVTVGAGIQFSRLNKMDVSEKKESFDYNNNLTATNTERYSSSASVYGASEKKIDAQKWDNRLMLEATWKKDRVLFSAGYLRGINPAVNLLQTDGSRHQYRNMYFKLGVQYQLR